MTTVLILIFFAFLLAGWIQGVLGFGFAIATTLLLINHMDFTTLVFFNLCMSVITSLIAMFSAKNLKSIHKKTLLKLIVSASAGLAVGLALISYIDAIVLKKITLGIILIASILSLSKVKSFFSHSYMAWGGGFFSGVLTPSTGINGPLVALHLNAAFTDKQQIRNTMLAYLFLIMAFGSVSMGFQNDFSSDTWILFFKVMPFAIIGYILGMLSFRLLSDRVFIRTVTLFLILSSVLSLIYLIV